MPFRWIETNDVVIFLVCLFFSFPSEHDWEWKLVSSHQPWQSCYNVIAPFLPTKDRSCNSNISRDKQGSKFPGEGWQQFLKWNVYTPSLTNSIAHHLWNRQFPGWHLIPCVCFGEWESNTYFLWHLAQFRKYSGHIPCFAWKMYLRSCQNDGQGSEW